MIEGAGKFMQMNTAIIKTNFPNQRQDLEIQGKPDVVAHVCNTALRRSYVRSQLELHI